MAEFVLYAVALWSAVYIWSVLDRHWSAVWPWIVAILVFTYAFLQH